MTFGHQNLEIRPIPGLDTEPAAKVVATTRPGDQPAAAPQAYLAGTLSRRSYEVLSTIGSLFKAVDTAHVPPERSEEHTSELQSLMRISYAVFCLKKNNN